MSEYIDIYIDTTTKVPEDATEFDHELFERFMSGGPWVAHSEYMKLKADNAKLVDVLHEVETEAVYAYNCLQQDCMTTANSSEHFFKKWWHAECELDRVKDENAKLRELVRDMWHHSYCSIAKTRKDDERHVEDVMKRMRELGVEVD